LGKNSDLSWV